MKLDSHSNSKHPVSHQPMKAKYLAIPVAAATVFMVSCENPADKTTSAEVNEAVEKTSDSAVGTKYVFTPESKIEFTGSKVTGKHDGGFKTFSGHFTVKDGKPVGNDHKVVIDMNSTWSDADKLTEHLKSADFFDVENHPESTVDVTDLKAGENGAYAIAGNSTLPGVTTH